jgi:hypothetical protein
MRGLHSFNGEGDPLKRSIFFIISFLFIVGSVQAAVDVNILSVTGDQATVQLVMWNTYGTDYEGVVLTRQPVGLCEEAVVVTPEPIPLPVDNGLEYPYWMWEEEIVETQVTLPEPGVNYEIKAWLADSAGDLHEFPVLDQAQISPPIYPSGHASIGDAPIMRGELVLGSDYHGVGLWTIYIIPCADGCWGDPELFHIASDIPEDHILFQNCFQGVVDLIGVPFKSDGMLYTYELYTLTDIVPAPAGLCGPVPEEESSLDGVKAMYR